MCPRTTFGGQELRGSNTCHAQYSWLGQRNGKGLENQKRPFICTLIDIKPYLRRGDLEGLLLF
jgi:hypothetical protein